MYCTFSFAIIVFFITSSSAASAENISCGNCIFLTWTAPASEFADIHQSSLESLLLMNPDASVTIFSNTLSPLIIFPYLHLGWNLSIQRLEDLLITIKVKYPSIFHWMDLL